MRLNSAAVGTRSMRIGGLRAPKQTRREIESRADDRDRQIFHNPSRCAGTIRSRCRPGRRPFAIRYCTNAPARCTSKPWTTSANWPAGGAMRATSRRTRIPMTLPRRCFSLIHGLIVMHHIVDDVPADALRKGLSLLGATVVGPYTLPAKQPQEG